MPTNKQAKPQREADRARPIDKRACVASVIALTLCGLIYFRADLKILGSASIGLQQDQHKLPDGLILLPYDTTNNICRLRAANGEIRDDGLVDCIEAAAQNVEVWRPLTNAQKAAEFRKSFRHE